MPKLVFKILMLILLISFSVEIATPLGNFSSVCLQMEGEETDEKKDNEKNESETKDKRLSNIKYLSSIQVCSDFCLSREPENTPGFLSMPDMPPDQV
jgi:hypothetical protein